MREMKFNPFPTVYFFAADFALSTEYDMTSNRLTKGFFCSNLVTLIGSADYSSPLCMQTKDI